MTVFQNVPIGFILFTDASYRLLNVHYIIELVTVKGECSCKLCVCLGIVSNSSSEMPGKDNGSMNYFRNVTESL